jgi:hypothetical protein
MSVARRLDDGDADNAQKVFRHGETDVRWQEISDEAVEFYDDILPFLDAIGFRYYIPRYMIWTLQHYQQSDLAIITYTVGIFSHCWEQWSVLNSKQQKACLRFLEFCVHDTSDRLDAEQARYAHRLLTMTPSS